MWSRLIQRLVPAPRAGPGADAREPRGDEPEAGDLPVLFLGSAVVVAAYVQFRPLVFDVDVPEAIFAGDSIVLGLLGERQIVLPVLAATAILLAAWRRLRWQRFEQARAIRGFVFALCLCLAWAFSTYDYNFYYDRSHALDRGILIALCLGVLLHPAALPCFLLVAYAIPAQFEGDVAFYSWNDKTLLYDVLILFTVYLYWKILRPRSLRVFLFLCLCQVGSFYFAAGVAKIELGWLEVNQLHNLVAAGHVNGWFFPDDEERALWWIGLARRLNGPMLLAAQATELAGILVLARRRASYAVLLACIGLHGMIVSTTGIFFWKWIWLDVALLALLGSLDAGFARQLYRWQIFAASVGVIVFAEYAFEPWGPAWYDTRLNTYYRFEGVGESGARYEIERRFFAPYDMVFAQNRFYFLSGDRHLVNTFGSVFRRDVFEALERAEPTRRSIRALESRLGRRYIRRRDSQRFEAFVVRFFTRLERRTHEKVALSALPAPHHILVRSPAGPRERYAVQEPLVRIHVFQIKRFYDGRRIHPIEERRVRTIEIPRAEPSR